MPRILLPRPSLRINFQGRHPAVWLLLLCFSLQVGAQELTRPADGTTQPASSESVSDAANPATSDVGPRTSSVEPVQIGGFVIRPKQLLQSPRLRTSRNALFNLLAAELQSARILPSHKPMGLDWLEEVTGEVTYAYDPSRPEGERNRTGYRLTSIQTTADNDLEQLIQRIDPDAKVTADQQVEKLTFGTQLVNRLARYLQDSTPPKTMSFPVVDAHRIVLKGNGEPEFAEVRAGVKSWTASGSHIAGWDQLQRGFLTVGRDKELGATARRFAPDHPARAFVEDLASVVVSFSLVDDELRADALFTFSDPAKARSHAARSWPRPAANSFHSPPVETLNEADQAIANALVSQIDDLLADGWANAQTRVEGNQIRLTTHATVPWEYVWAQCTTLIRKRYEPTGDLAEKAKFQRGSSLLSTSSSLAPADAPEANSLEPLVPVDSDAELFSWGKGASSAKSSGKSAKSDVRTSTKPSSSAPWSPFK